MFRPEIQRPFCCNGPRAFQTVWRKEKAGRCVQTVFKAYKYWARLCIKWPTSGLLSFGHFRCSITWPTYRYRCSMTFMSRGCVCILWSLKEDKELRVGPVVFKEGRKEIKGLLDIENRSRRSSGFTIASTDHRWTIYDDKLKFGRVIVQGTEVTEVY